MNAPGSEDQQPHDYIPPPRFGMFKLWFRDVFLLWVWRVVGAVILVTLLYQCFGRDCGLECVNGGCFCAH